MKKGRPHAALKFQPAYTHTQGMINESSDSLRLTPLFETSSNSTACPSLRTPEASALHRRDMNDCVLAAALRLDEAVTHGRIEPFHGACRQASKQSQSNIVAAGVLAHAEGEQPVPDILLFTPPISG